MNFITYLEIKMENDVVLKEEVFEYFCELTSEQIIKTIEDYAKAYHTDQLEKNKLAAK